MTELSPVEKSTGTSVTFSDDHCNHTVDKEHAALQGYKNTTDTRIQKYLFADDI